MIKKRGSVARELFCSVCRFTRTHGKCPRCRQPICYDDSIEHWQHFAACFPDSIILQNAVKRSRGELPEPSSPVVPIMDVRDYVRRRISEPETSGEPTRTDRTPTGARPAKAFQRRAKGR